MLHRCARIGIGLSALVLLCTSVLFIATSWQAARTNPFWADSPGHLSTTTKNGQNIQKVQNAYLLGVGRADITGPVVEVNMMGYADTSQVGSGLRQRIYCRAFIVAHPEHAEARIAYLVLDTQSGDTAVRHGIVEALHELGPEYAVYTRPGVLAVTGTHSHSGPGAWLNYLLPQITSKGFSKESYGAIVAGSVRAIQRAHNSLGPGRLLLGTGNTTGISANRSPYAYLKNPASERARYDTDTDTVMTVLQFDDLAGKSLGILTWLPVHGTSLYQNNTLIAGDNKGVAAYLFEERMSEVNPSFVAGFSQSNVGDTTPNVLGAFCESTGLACRFNDSTCNGRTQGCRGRGPFFQAQDQGSKSCYEIGKRQAAAAQAILDSRSMNEIPLDTIESFHIFHDMSNFTFTSPSDPSRTLRTCSAALGYGFAGGTTDGPGAFDFRQGTNDTDDDSPALKNPLWRIARSFVHSPTDDQIKCQSPKPILLDVGAAKKPYAWTPNIVDIQMQRVGPLLIIVVPGEATTMAGRRWREAIAAQAETSIDIVNPVVVIGGPANTYAHYIATEEEYTVQRYEGASTLYGPHTLAAYINLTTEYLPYLDRYANSNNSSPRPPLAHGPQPPININSSYNFINKVILDSPGLFRSFGQLLTGPSSDTTYHSGDTITATFVGANPRNNFRLEHTFAAVERYNATHDHWLPVRTDRDWFLTYHWRRVSTVLGTSEVTLKWEVDSNHSRDKDRKEGERAMFRFRYYGDAKSIGGTITAFEGVSDSFFVEM